VSRVVVSFASSAIATLHFLWVSLKAWYEDGTASYLQAWVCLDDLGE